VAGAIRHDNRVALPLREFGAHCLPIVGPALRTPLKWGGERQLDVGNLLRAIGIAEGYLLQARFYGVIGELRWEDGFLI